MDVPAPLTVGFAFDVSGSMKGNIQNVAGKGLSRLDGLRQAMDALLAEAAGLASLLFRLATRQPSCAFSRAPTV